MAEQTFGAYVTQTEVISAAAQTETLANIARFKALIPDPADASVRGRPDFDAIQPFLAKRLRAEIDALTTAIDAAPTA
jgi:hypothetical protein